MGHEADALLHQVADRTIGYSGADLANLLNEASILSVSMPCYRHHVHILWRQQLLCMPGGAGNPGSGHAVVTETLWPSAGEACATPNSAPGAERGVSAR